ncbi:MAG: zinc-dependent peptidase [Thermogutta sp.]|nr:zinc-dependent peptidase [Thermogutta sp.]
MLAGAGIAGDAARDSPASAAAFTPTEQYHEELVAGRRVLAHPSLYQDESLWGRVKQSLAEQLEEIDRVLPPKALEKLRGVTIWAELETNPRGGMAYHPSREWLASHGINPDKAKGIEITNARNFLGWRKTQPCMVLHETAHAYHDQVLPGGYGNRRIHEAWERATQAGLYDEVKHVQGHTERAYAIKDPMEFFAENTEAFFGRNDFYPFDREELRRHDPETYRMIAELWGVPRSEEEVMPDSQ